ncbi:MAG: hypothetical protein FJ387_31270, partial [Verrucomicrobia bacterium]|nr:hypothetical protein [Verrucomicrobiota bacterium]
AFPGNAWLRAGCWFLTWEPSANALTVSCWFKLSVPSGTTLSQNLTILTDREAHESAYFAYWIEFELGSGDVVFSTAGRSGTYRNTLIDRPYLDRWYHVAVVRSGETFRGYVDGREVFADYGNVGQSQSAGILSVGCWNNTQYLFGEVQEVAIHRAALSRAVIADHMFADQSGLQSLRGYYKLGYYPDEADSLKNRAPGASTCNLTQAGPGKVTFDETNQAGEQSAFDSRKNGGRDAIVPLSGAFNWEQVAFARPTPGIAFDFRFGYSSANAFGGFKLGSTDPFDAGPLGPGWRHTFETRLLPAQDFDPNGGATVLGLMSWNGAIETWDLNLETGKYQTRHQEYRGELAPATNILQFQWTTPDRQIFLFRNPNINPQVMRGRLEEIHDFNGNSVKIRWDQAIGLITQVVDSARGRYDFRYNARNLLTTFAFGQWLVNFDYDSTGRLRSKSLANSADLYTNINTLWQFQYGSNGLLSHVIDPRGKTNNFVQYDPYGRKTNEVDAVGRTNRTEYGAPGKRDIRHTDPAGFPWVETYDRRGRLLVQEDPLHNKTRYTYDDAGNRIAIADPLGFTTRFGYDDRANVISRTNALGQVSRWVFHSFFNKPIQEITPQPPDASGWTTWTNFFELEDATGNLLRHYDALGNLVRYAYKTNGLVETAIDANNHTNRFEYDTNGFMTARFDAAGYRASFGYNDVGWKLAETNALDQPRSYALDLNGNVVLRIDPLRRAFTNVFDPNGNLTHQYDAKGNLTAHFYDAANQRTQTVDRLLATNIFTYTSRGKPFTATDALANTSTNYYDAANRLDRSIDPLGNTTTNFYDASGRLTDLFDKLGQR